MSLRVQCASLQRSLDIRSVTSAFPKHFAHVTIFKQGVSLYTTSMAITGMLIRKSGMCKSMSDFVATSSFCRHAFIFMLC